MQSGTYPKDPRTHSHHFLMIAKKTFPFVMRKQLQSQDCYPCHVLHFIVACKYWMQRKTWVFIKLLTISENCQQLNLIQDKSCPTDGFFEQRLRLNSHPKAGDPSSIKWQQQWWFWTSTKLTTGTKHKKYQGRSDSKLEYKMENRQYSHKNTRPARCSSAKEEGSTPATLRPLLGHCAMFKTRWRTSPMRTLPNWHYILL